MFFACFELAVLSGVVLVERVDQLGLRLGFSEGLLGTLIALAADAPEIASAVTAIVGGHHDLGLGAVFGSNLFNLAALLGLSAVTAGAGRVGRIGL